MKSKTSILFAALVLSFVAFVALGATAQAGIIVTVGKPMPDDQARRVKTGAVVTYSSPNGEAGERTAQSACYVDKAGVTICSQKIDPFTGMPADWHCVPIGNSQLYCEGPGIGVGPGEGGEGYFDPSYDEGGFDDGEADTEIEAMGCAGGMGLSGGIFGVVSVLAMLGFMVRGRRR